MAAKKRAPLLSSTGERVSVRARRDARARLAAARHEAALLDPGGPHWIDGDEARADEVAAEIVEAKAELAAAHHHPFDTLGTPGWTVPNDYCALCLRAGTAATYAKREEKLFRLARSLPDLDLLIGRLIEIRWRMRGNGGRLEAWESKMLEAVLDGFRQENGPAARAHHVFEALAILAERVASHQKRLAKARGEMRDRLHTLVHKEIRAGYIVLCRRWLALAGRGPAPDDVVVFEAFAAVVEAIAKPKTPWVHLLDPVEDAFGIGRRDADQRRKMLQRARSKVTRIHGKTP